MSAGDQGAAALAWVYEVRVGRALPPNSPQPQHPHHRHPAPPRHVQSIDPRTCIPLLTHILAPAPCVHSRTQWRRSHRTTSTKPRSRCIPCSGPAQRSPPPPRLFGFAAAWESPETPRDRDLTRALPHAPSARPPMPSSEPRAPGDFPSGCSWCWEHRRFRIYLWAAVCPTAWQRRQRRGQ